VPLVVEAKKGRDVLNGQWSVQSKASLLTRKLKYNKGGGKMIGSTQRDGDLPLTRLGSTGTAESIHKEFLVMSRPLPRGFTTKSHNIPELSFSLPTGRLAG